MHTIRLKLLMLMVIFTTANIQADTDTASFIRIDSNGLGIDGYSPVSYFTDNKAELGKAEFTHQVNGITYHLTNQEQLDLFKANPQDYLPAHGGWCSLMLSGSGQLTPANPQSYKIIDGQLLLFWDGSFKGQPVNGLNNWHSKTDKDPKKASKRLQKANKTWEKIKQGEKPVKLVIFDEADKKRLNQAWLAQAKKKY